MKVLKPKKLKTLPQYFEEVVKGNKKALKENDKESETEATEKWNKRICEEEK